mmetsp:Transcript_23711/g.57190  ORF Transcript_23711/g.57190 Transcript_23711/m.57190 type:complete len:200 (+) Transcript_23711:121-720(+)
MLSRYPSSVKIHWRPIPRRHLCHNLHTLCVDHEQPRLPLAPKVNLAEQHAVVLVRSIRVGYKYGLGEVCRVPLVVRSYAIRVHVELEEAKVVVVPRAQGVRPKGVYIPRMGLSIQWVDRGGEFSIGRSRISRHGQLETLFDLIVPSHLDIVVPHVAHHIAELAAGVDPVPPLRALPAPFQSHELILSCQLIGNVVTAEA